MPELTLIIGNKNYSSWSLRPWLFMKHAGIPFKEKRIALYADTSRTELAPYHSNYKVPVLKDGDLLVWDSLAILEYIVEWFPDSHGWPEDTKARAMARSVCAEMHSSFADLRSELPMNCRRRYSAVTISDAAQKDIERIKELWRMCRGRYGSGGEWLFGQFCIADAMYAPIALRFAGYGILVSGIEAAYVQSVLRHPHIVEWMEAGRQEQEILADFERDSG
jgi:glutathione S-transferase